MKELKLSVEVTEGGTALPGCEVQFSFDIGEAVDAGPGKGLPNHVYVASVPVNPDAAAPNALEAIRKFVDIGDKVCSAAVKPIAKGLETLNIPPDLARKIAKVTKRMNRGCDVIKLADLIRVPEAVTEVVEHFSDPNGMGRAQPYVQHPNRFRADVPTTDTKSWDAQKPETLKLHWKVNFEAMPKYAATEQKPLVEGPNTPYEVHVTFHDIIPGSRVELTMHAERLGSNRGSDPRRSVAKRFRRQMRESVVTLDDWPGSPAEFDDVLIVYINGLEVWRETMLFGTNE